MNARHQKDLLCCLAEGDQTALASIYHEYWQPLFISAYNILKDRKACEDIVQEIFLHLWLKRAHLQVRESLKVYLLAATRYQVFRHIRKAAVRGEFELLEERLTALPDDLLLLKDLVRMVDEVVAGLPQKCRIVYQLSREESLSHKEIADRLNISIKTVENQITIALRRLRHSLQACSLSAILLAIGVAWFI